MAVNKVIYGGRTLIDLTGDTVTADKLLTGFTAHDKSGAVIEGGCTFDSDTGDDTAPSRRFSAEGRRTPEESSSPAPCRIAVR